MKRKKDEINIEIKQEKKIKKSTECDDIKEAFNFIRDEKTKKYKGSVVLPAKDYPILKSLIWGWSLKHLDKNVIKNIMKFFDDNNICYAPYYIMEKYISEIDPNECEREVLIKNDYTLSSYQDMYCEIYGSDEIMDIECYTNIIINFDTICGVCGENYCNVKKKKNKNDDCKHDLFLEKQNSKWFEFLTYFFACFILMLFLHSSFVHNCHVENVSFKKCYAKFYEPSLDIKCLLKSIHSWFIRRDGFGFQMTYLSIYIPIDLSIEYKCF